jgi:putative Holliday junction resolvase
VRIGVAVSDSNGRVATPVEVLVRSNDRQSDHRALADMAAEWEVDLVVVGVPYSLDGTIGPTAERMLAEIEELGDTLTVPVDTYDERLSTVTAERTLMEQNLDGRKRRKVVDMVAASVILQGWLDAQVEDDIDD